MTGRIDRALTWEGGRAVLHVADCPHARAMAEAGEPVLTLLDCAHEPAAAGTGRMIDRCRCPDSGNEKGASAAPVVAFWVFGTPSDYPSACGATPWPRRARRIGPSQPPNDACGPEAARCESETVFG